MKHNAPGINEIFKIKEKKLSYQNYTISLELLHSIGNQIFSYKKLYLSFFVVRSCYSRYETLLLGLTDVVMSLINIHRLKNLRIEFVAVFYEARGSRLVWLEKIVLQIHLTILCLADLWMW